MARPDEQDDFARRRIAALGLTKPGWVPDQSDVTFAPPEPKESTAAAGSHAASGIDLAARLRQVDLTANGRALLGLAAVCACLLIVTAWALLRPRPTPPPAPLPAPAAAALPTPTPAGIVVDVGGRVRRPGLVTLPLGSRVADAVKAAGGALRARDLMQVNLAAKVADGQLLLIGLPDGAGSDPAAAASGTAGPVNLNSATIDQLDALPGIGPVLAQRILDWRSANGGFTTVRDLDQVSGIGDAIFSELEPLVTV